MAKKGRKRVCRDVDFWRDAQARWKASDLSASAFCVEEDLSASTFALWRRRLRDEADQEATPTVATLLPVEVVGMLDAAGGCEIFLPGDRRVLVQPGFDEKTLRRVLSCLE